MTLRRHRRRGVIIILAALFMVAMVAMLALTIDLGMMTNLRGELQMSADSAALAGAGDLLENPDDVTASARFFAKRNYNSSRPLLDSDINVVVGQWDEKRRSFLPGAQPYDAVRVSTLIPHNPFYFGKALGSESYSMGASATASVMFRDILLVLDYSGSMEGKKIGQLKKAVKSFGKLVKESGRGQDRIGFVRYSSEAYLEETLTGDVERVSDRATYGEADGFTNIGGGLELGLNELQRGARSGAKRTLLLLTDGLANRPHGRDPVQYVRDQAYRAANERVVIFAISFGDDADESLMREVGTITRGSFYRVSEYDDNDFTGLEGVFRTIAKNRPLQLVD